MPSLKPIKIHLAILLGLTIIFATMAVVSYQYNILGFSNHLYDRSSQQVEVLDHLSSLHAKLYAYQQGLQESLKVDSQVSPVDLSAIEKVAIAEFTALNQFNQKQFKGWPTVEPSPAMDPKSELQKILVQKNDLTNIHELQKVFFLVQNNIEFYFADVEKRKVELTEVDPIGYAKVALVGLDRLQLFYQQQFWNKEQTGFTAYNYQAQLLFWALIGLAATLLIYMSLTLRKAFVMGRGWQLKQELTKVSVKDPATGLYTQDSFESLTNKEIERAKRKGYNFGLLLIRVEPLAQIRKDLGDEACDRLLYQVSEVLKSCYRSYDGFFKYQANYFALVLPEIADQALNNIVARFKQQIENKSFLVKNNQTKVIPKISAGFAVYPQDGEKIKDLVDVAKDRLSDTFEYEEDHLTIEPAVAMSAEGPSDYEVVVDEVSVISQMDNLDSADELMKKLAEGPVDVAIHSAKPSSVSMNEVLLEEEAHAPVQVEVPVEDKQAEDKSVDFIPIQFNSFNQTVGEFFKSPVSVLEEFKEVTIEDVVKADDIVMSSDDKIEVSEGANDDLHRKESPLPDAILAVTESEQKLNQLAKEAAEIKKAIAAKQAAPVIQKIEPTEEEKIQADIEEKYKATSNTGGISEIQVVKEGEDDVIMVDFEREKDDLAEKFRRKQRQRRRRHV
jgi:diguanylate cyclase (GGDEF)-like protein